MGSFSLFDALQSPLNTIYPEHYEHRYQQAPGQQALGQQQQQQQQGYEQFRDYARQSPLNTIYPEHYEHRYQQALAQQQQQQQHRYQLGYERFRDYARQSLSNQAPEAEIPTEMEDWDEAFWIATGIVVQGTTCKTLGGKDERVQSMRDGQARKALSRGPMEVYHMRVGTQTSLGTEAPIRTDV